MADKLRIGEKRVSFSLMSKLPRTNALHPSTGIIKKAKYINDKIYGVTAVNRANSSQADFCRGSRQ